MVPSLLPAEPAREAALGLAGLLLDLLVELVDLLDGGILGVLCVVCGLGLAFLELGLGLGELLGRSLCQWSVAEICLDPRGWGGLIARSTAGSRIRRGKTYSLVELGTSLFARGLCLLLVLLAPAGQLSLDLCGGLVDVGC